MNGTINEQWSQNILENIDIKQSFKFYHSNYGKSKKLVWFLGYTWCGFCGTLGGYTKLKFATTLSMASELSKKAWCKKSMF